MKHSEVSPGLTVIHASMTVVPSKRDCLAVKTSEFSADSQSFTANPTATTLPCSQVVAQVMNPLTPGLSVLVFSTLQSAEMSSLRPMSLKSEEVLSSLRRKREL